MEPDQPIKGGTQHAPRQKHGQADGGGDRTDEEDETKMKTIVKPGKPTYRDVLISGRFECRNCGCNFLAEKEDMEFENIYISGDILKIPYSSCPNCGETCGMLCGNYRRELASELQEG